MADISRVVALGASNLTRAFRTVVSAARTEWGPGVEVFAALGHGRSYGARSRVLFQTLPGILQSGLWRSLESMPPVPARAFLTDIGNDILYGHSPGRILEWIEEAVSRLQRFTPDITITGLPIEKARSLSPAGYQVFRSLIFPSSKLSFPEVLCSAEQVEAGLERLAAARGCKLCRQSREWYGADPIHIRRSFIRPAWRQILDCGLGAGADEFTFSEALRLYFMAPERRRIFGIKQFTPQRGVALPHGGRVWLF